MKSSEDTLQLKGNDVPAGSFRKTNYSYIFEILRHPRKILEDYTLCVTHINENGYDVYLLLLIWISNQFLMCKLNYYEGRWNADGEYQLDPSIRYISGQQNRRCPYIKSFIVVNAVTFQSHKEICRCYQHHSGRKRQTLYNVIMYVRKRIAVQMLVSSIRIEITLHKNRSHHRITNLKLYFPVFQPFFQSIWND